jgi:hypothetical protein
MIVSLMSESFIDSSTPFLLDMSEPANLQPISKTPRMEECIKTNRGSQRAAFRVDGARVPY